ncbi:hypothetical protein DH2020_029900 [Rehmannia glutinosa]|uniref:L-ascorbate oxidase n=1 Tax=Rehmannia glutinosa TaxID=99300 RepID=A0ABR0VN28_REHGL
MGKTNFLFLALVSTFVVLAHAEDPYLFYTWNVKYATLSPLGVPQQVITINDQFPGPWINSTSNNNIVVNVFNHLDEPLLFTWNGIQQRKNSWQEGTLGTNCPIQPGTNFTFHFQVKDQIGSYYYYPTTALHRAAGGYGPLTIHSRDLIPVPFDWPEAEYNVLVGDWYAKSHATLKKQLDAGRTIGKPDGVIINGKNGIFVNGVSHTNTETPLKLAEYFGVSDKVFKYDIIKDEPAENVGDKITMAPNVINATFRNFVEIIFENQEKSVQSWHLSGYSFFAVAIEPGRWTPEKRKNYNLIDAVSRHTIHVYPKSWAAIMTTLDNAGMWNLRALVLERQYLGQQLYISVLSPERSLRDEYNMLDDQLVCGIVKGMPVPKPYAGA